jgi:hypothetical protein
MENNVKGNTEKYNQCNFSGNIMNSTYRKEN